MSLLFSILTALSLTLLFELLFALVWGLRKQELLLVVLMNLLTNPAVTVLYFLAAYFLGWHSFWLVLALEAAAIITEGFCCRGVVKRPWLFTFLINLFSYSMGELLQRLI